MCLSLRGQLQTGGSGFYSKHEALFFVSQHWDLGSDIWEVYSVHSFW